MENLKGLLLPNTFNKCGYVGVFLWAVIGVILLGVFAEMDNGERSDFRCKAKLQEMDFVRAKCFEEYDKRHNKYRFPVYGFVLINFLFIGIVSAVYSQVMKSTVDDHQKELRVRDAERQRPPETRTLDLERQRPPETRRLFVAYCCQLMVRFAFGIVAIVLQTQLLYPSIFPSDFNCDLSSPATNASASKNSTKYECHNQRAWQKTVSMHAVIVVNGFFAVLIFIEFMAILILRVQRGKTFLKDSEFLKHYLQLQDQQGSQQEPLQLRPEQQHVSQQEPLPQQDLPEDPPQQRQEKQGSQQKPLLLRSEQQVSLEEPQQRGEQQGSQQEPPPLRPEQQYLPEELEEPRQQRPEQESSQQEPPRPEQRDSPKEPPQQKPEQKESLEEPPKQRAEQPESLQGQLLSSFIKSLKKRIIEETEKPPDLRALFQPKPGEGKRIKDLKIDSIYTKLVLIPNRAKYDFRGNREEQLKEYPMPKENLQPLEKPEEIVDPENKITLMVGRPGIGKTLFSTKFMRDWASDKVFNKTQDTDLHYEMAFLIKFRKFNWIKQLSLRELLTGAEYLRQERIPDEVWHYICKHPDRVLIFFDGLDEMKEISNIAEQTVNDNYANSEEQAIPLATIYSKLVSGKLLRGATIITTTRPNAVSSLSSTEFGKTIEILGFSEDQVEEYVKNFTKETEESLGKTGEKIWQHISTNMNLFSLCYVPVNCFIICSCLLQIIQHYTKKGKDLTGAVLPEKFTQIYKIAMKLFFFRHNEQYKDKVLTRKEIESDKFPPPELEEKIFKPLGQVAFNGVKERRLIFGESEVQGLEDSGLLHQLPDDESDPWTHEAQFCFIHLTMQEFFAARHIVDTKNEAELREFVSDNINKDEWHVVMQFVSGLLGERKLPIEIFTAMLPVETEKYDDGLTDWPTSSDQHLALTILKCLFESGESKESHSVVKSKLEEIGFNAVDFRGCDLAPSDCTAVVHVLKNVPQISRIYLSGNHIGSLGCVEIRKLLDNGNCQITALYLEGNNIGDNGVLELCKVINNSKLTTLDLRRNNIDDNGVLELCNVITNSKLTWLDLTDNKITDVGVNNLCDVLTNPNCKLTWLGLWGNKAKTAEAQQRITHANPNCQVII